MKKTRSLVAILICLSMLASILCVNVAAAETASIELDFTTLTANSDISASAEAIVGLGAEESSNIYIADCYNPFISVNGYSSGYFVMKLSAGDGKVFSEAPVVTLNYRLTSGQSDTGDDPYVKVEGSLDGEIYYDFATLSEKTGEAYTLDAKAEATITLNGGENTSTIWVKVSLRNYAGPDGAGIDKIAVSGAVKDDPNATPAPAGIEVSKTLDFTTLTANSDISASAEAIVGLGAEESSNIYVADCYNPFISVNGYSSGYFVMKLSAGDGKVFSEAPVVTLNYRLTSGQSDTGDDPYVKVEGSLDGEIYYDFATLSEKTGEAYTLDAKAEATITLNGGENASTIWVKVSLRNYAGPDGAGIDKIIVAGLVEDAPDAPSNPDEGGDDVTDPSVPDEGKDPEVPEVELTPVGTASGELDFSTITGVPQGASLSVEDSAVAMEKLGVVESADLILTDCFTVMATPREGFMNAYYVQKLDAGNGKVFANDATLDLTYWLAIHAEFGVGYVKVEVSEDGEEYTEVWSDKEGRGEEFKENARTTDEIDLGDVAGWDTIYVRVSINRQGGYTCGGVVKSVITADVANDPDASGDEDTTTPDDEKNPETDGEDDKKPSTDQEEDNKPSDKDENNAEDKEDTEIKTELVKVNSSLDFTNLEKTSDKNAVSTAVKGLGAVEVSNLIIDDCYNPFLAVQGYTGEGYYIQKLSVGEDTFAEDPVLTLNYRLSQADPMGSIKVLLSTDGETYKEVGSLTKATGAGFTLDAKASADIVLKGAKGASSVWVKVVMVNYSSPDGCGVDSSVINGVVETTTGSEVVITETISKTADFSTLTKNNDAAAVEEAVKGLGIEEVSNLYIDDCYTPFLSVKGYAGEGYFIQKLSAGEGETFLDAPILSLNYRLSQADPMGSITILVSTDGVNYEEVAVLDEATGSPYTLDCKASANITLASAKGASAVWVKVVMVNYSSPDGCGVDMCTISGSVKAAGSPATGDGFNIGAVVLAMLSVTGAAVVTVKSRKEID